MSFAPHSQRRSMSPSSHSGVNGPRRAPNNPQAQDHIRSSASVEPQNQMMNSRNSSRQPSEIDETQEEQKQDLPHATSNPSIPPTNRVFSLSPRNLERLAIAMSYCFINTFELTGALTQRDPDILTKLMFDICSTKQREFRDSYAATFIRILADGKKIEDAKSLLEAVLNRLNRSIHSFHKLTEVVEVVSIAHNPPSKKSCMYLEVNCFSQLECIAKQLLDKYEPEERIEKRNVCGISERKIYRQSKVMRIGKILLVYASRNGSKAPGECYPSCQISLKLSSVDERKKSEKRFVLNAALSYESDRHSFAGYYSINNKWYLVKEGNLSSITLAEIEEKKCFLFFFKQEDDENFHRGVSSDFFNAMPSHGSFYILTLYALLLNKEFLQICLAHNRGGLESLPGMIGKILENVSSNESSSFCFEKVWKRYFLPMASQISTPSTFLKYFFENINSKYDYETATLFNTKFQKFKWCLNCSQPKPRDLCVCEQLVHLPIKDVPRIIEKLPENFSIEINQSIPKEKSIMRYLSIKQKSAFSNSEKKMMHCGHLLHTKSVKMKKLKEAGRLLIFDFYTNDKTKPQEAKLHVETSLVLSFDSGSINYHLKAVIKDHCINSAYVMIDGTWYALNLDAIKKIDHLPYSMEKVHVVIYEMDGVKDEIPFNFTRKSAKIVDVFKHLHKYIQHEEKIPQTQTSQSPTSVNLKHQFKSQIYCASPSIPRRCNNPQRGLPNLSQSCYFNAVMNCLYYSTDFSDIINHLQSSAPTELTSALSYFFRHYQNSHVDLRNTITTILKQMGFEEVTPDDVHWFFLTLLKKLMSVVSSDLSRKLKELFEIKERPSRIACVRCQGEPCSMPKSLVLTVSKPEETDLGSLISTLYNSCCETGHLCKECRRLLPCPRLVSVGAILPIFLECIDPRLLHRVTISCPATLDMNVWAAFSGKYELYGAVKIREQAASCHAVATIKINANWWCFDDETVEPFDEFEEVEGSPYLLFYEKVQVSLNTHIPPFKGLGLPSNRLIFSVLTALFYSPKLFTFLTDQDFSELAGVSRSIGDFFKSFQREPLSEAVTFHLQFLDINNMDPASAFAFVIQSLVRDVQNDKDIFHRNTEVKKALKFPTFPVKCAGLHEMCAVLTEIQNVCKSCYSSNTNQYLLFSQVLKMQVPHRLEDTKDETLFGGDEAYYCSISSKYKTQNAKNLKDYCDALRDFSRMQRHNPEPGEISAVDLYTCFRYNNRLFSNQATHHCKQCQDERLHFTQQFIRFLGAVLVIEIARIEEESRVAFSQEVAFPYQLDLSEIVEGVSLYELKSFLCKESGDTYAVTVNLSGNWYTFQGGEVKPANPGANFYENACVLVYEQARKRVV